MTGDYQSRCASMFPLTGCVPSPEADDQEAEEGTTAASELQGDLAREGVGPVV